MSYCAESDLSYSEKDFLDLSYSEEDSSDILSVDPLLSAL